MSNSDHPPELLVQQSMPKSPRASSDDEIDLAQIGQALWGQRKFISLITVVTAIAALIISFALPKQYMSEASILPRAGNDASGAIAASLAAQLGPAAGMFGGLGSGKTAELVEILSSRSMAERIIAVCGLERELKGWKHREDLVTKVQKMTTIVPPSLKNRVIGIKVYAPSPELAAAMANAYLDQLKDMLDEIGYNSAAKNRLFIEKQLARTKADLATAEEKLAKFQAENQIASLPDTVLASIKSISDLQAQNVSTEVQLKATNEVLDAMRSKVSALQADPNALIELEVKQKSLAAQRNELSKAQSAFLGKLTKLPPQGMALARLQRDVQVQNAIYLALSQNYETAMISENKDSDAFLPLDRAVAPHRASKPNKKVLVMIGLLAGFILGCFAALVRTRAQANVPVAG